LIRLGDKFGKDKLEAACAKAVAIGAPRYQTIKSLLALGPQRHNPEAEVLERPTPEHGNIRGRTYYN
jgi:hypothetical protein